jgi:glycosyltransferase involved in cell wall biosynthesis
MTDISLVSIVIPAFNAGRTLLETLQSVSSQTYEDLEITVVDDGSADDTAEIAQAYAQTDPRVTLIRQPNGGVAAARNAGIRASAGAFVAFIDADDLWHPTKIAKQAARLRTGGDETALVYAPFRQVDMQGLVHGASRNHRVEGWVINRHFYVNIIGNGSSILIRRHVLDELGGYASVLLQHNAQGCEDLLLQLRAALRYKFATVPEYLVGYRHAPGNMSSDEERMLRSTLLTLSLVLAECPDFVELRRHGLLARKIWEYLKIMPQRRNFKNGSRFIWPYLKGHFGAVANAAWIDAAGKARNLACLAATLSTRQRQSQAPIAYRHFYEYDPADMNPADHLPTTKAREAADEIYRNLLALAGSDRAYLPEKYLGREVATSSALERSDFFDLEARDSKVI